LTKDNNLYLIFDEIYHKLVYNGKKSVMLCDIIGDVPAISLKGVSKEFPWPGSRCGWMEFYNADKDESFARYVNMIVQKRCQRFALPRFPRWLSLKLWNILNSITIYLIEFPTMKDFQILPMIF